MNKFIQKLKDQIFFLILLIFFIGVSITNCKPEKEDLCNAYKDYFDGEGSVFTYEDSVNVLKFNQRLKELYVNNKDVYISDTKPNSYQFIYDMKNYDTTLLFKVLDLYSKDTIKYKEDFGIPWSLATGIIRNDAVIKGKVVDKINHFKECRYFVTTYFVEVDSIIHSYFPLNIGDTVLIHCNFFGVTGYCEFNKSTGITKVVGVKDYKIGESELYFFLDRAGYVRTFYLAINIPDSKYKDPYCYNSFFRNIMNEGYSKHIIKCNKLKLSKFVKKIKK